MTSGSGTDDDDSLFEVGPAVPDLDDGRFDPT
jgi:hypothetical protein